MQLLCLLFFIWMWVYWGATRRIPEEVFPLDIRVMIKISIILIALAIGLEVSGEGFNS